MLVRAKRGWWDVDQSDGRGQWRDQYPVEGVETLVKGTRRDDFIHAVHDHLNAPDGYKDLAVLAHKKETIDAGLGNDIVYGGERDTVYGGEGDDVLYGAQYSGVLYGEEGVDTIHGDTMYGGTGADILYGHLFKVAHPADISGLAEQIYAEDYGGLWFESNGGYYDLTKCILSGVSGIKTISDKDRPYFIDVTLAQFTELTGLVNFDRNPPYGQTVIHVVDAGVVDFNNVYYQYIDLHGSIGNDTWSFDPGTGQLDNFNVYLGDGDDKLTITGVYGIYFGAHLDGGDGDDAISVSSDNMLLSDKNTLTGDAGNDVLSGSSFDDVIDGGSGEDDIFGSGGSDYLTGGADADVFRYGSVKQSGDDANERDAITDFHTAEGDRIDLSQIDADTKHRGDQAFHLGGDAFTGSYGEIIQTVDAFGTNTLQMDVNGDKQADMAIILYSAGPLIAADFIL